MKEQPSFTNALCEWTQTNLLNKLNSNKTMKQLNLCISASMKDACRKLLLASAILTSSAFATSAMAQTQDGRDFSIDGFAAYEGTPGTNWYRAGGTTGGAGGKVVKANTFSELQAYLQAEDPYIVIVDHDITTGIKCYVDNIDAGQLLEDQSGAVGEETTYGERILVAPNKTLVGVVDPATGKAPLFSRITFVMQSVDNIIIRNCRFTMVGVPILKSGENKVVAWRNGAPIQVGDPDCIGIQADKEGATKSWGAHIWVDHCEFSNGDAANKDRYDGLLDCKNNVQWLTFSYNLFHDHDKSCLFGKGNSDNYDGCRTISFHHNFFNNIQGSRLPQQRGGQLHYYNNYMLNCEDGFRLNDKAETYMEACYFESTKKPVFFKGEKGLNINKNEGYDLIYKGCDRLIEGYTNIDGAAVKESYSLTATDWIPTQTAFTYTQNYLDKTADVPSICEKYAGAGKVEIWKAYTDVIPSENITEFDHAIKNPSSINNAKTYDANGNEMKEASTTGISVVEKSSVASAIVKTEYYDLSGVRLSAPQHGINLVKTTTSDGQVSVRKVVMK